MAHRKYGCAALFALAFCLLACGQAAAQQSTEASAAPVQSPRRAATPEIVSAWISQLAADEFLVRETAMLQLLEAGPAVLPALRPILATGDLEATSRALFIVRQIGLSADLDTKDSAGELLAELASRKETPALARRAAAAWDELLQQRSAQALAELEEMGVKVSRSAGFGGFMLDEAVMSVEVGDAFRGQESDLRRLKWLSNVPMLIFSGKKAADDCMKHAAALPGLEELHLYQTRLSDEALVPLAEHPTLRQLGIYYSPVGDGVLTRLAKMPQLNYLKLYGTQITSDALNKFKNSSTLGIDYKRGAFLGVGGIDVDGACVISTVHEGSPAEKGGLQREDIIVRFGGTDVSNFSTLMALIATREVGEEVEIDVSRRTSDDQGNPAGRKISTKVTLAPWEAELAIRNPRR